jgi:hypothetical protein
MARLEQLLGAQMGVPYDVDSYYMPLVTPKEVADSGVALQHIIPLDRFDYSVMKEFCDQIGESYRGDLPDHDEIRARGLGLGYGQPENFIYDAAIRSYDPHTIIEIGCGISTWYARNATNARIICIEPYPAPNFVGWCAENNVELWEMPLQKAAASLPLQGRVLLFIDSTHVAKITSELHLVFTTLLPALPVGSLIHFHDIFLPYPCLRPTHNGFPMTVNWYESTLLGVFLSTSPQFEILLAQYWMGHDDVAREMLKQAVPYYRQTGAEGSSFWLRKAGSP